MLPQELEAVTQEANPKGCLIGSPNGFPNGCQGLQQTGYRSSSRYPVALFTYAPHPSKLGPGARLDLRSWWERQAHDGWFRAFVLATSMRSPTGT